MSVSRQNNYDWLRVLCAFMVVLIHVNAKFFIPKMNTGMIDGSYTIEILFNIISRFSVPCFVMLSGAFLLDKKENMNYKIFYKKSFMKILVPYLIVWGVWMCRLLLGAILVSHDYKGVLKEFLLGTYGNLWFMPMLIVLYTFTPLLIKFKYSISQKEYYIIGIVLLIWAVISQRTTTYLLPYSMGVVMSYLSYFLLGNILYNMKKSNKKVCFFVFVGISIVILVGVTLYYRLQGNNYYQVDPYSAFFSPTMVLISILVFLFFHNLDISADIKWLADKTYYIYLFHTPVLIAFEVFYKVKIFNNEIISICVLTIIIFIISVGVACVFEKIINVINDTIIRKYIKI